MICIKLIDMYILLLFFLLLEIYCADTTIENIKGEKRRDFCYFYETVEDSLEQVRGRLESSR